MHLRYTIFILLSLLIYSCAIIQPRRKSPNGVYCSEITKQPFDAIIVPGVPFYGESWSSRMKTRVVWSKFLFDNGYAKNIIYSGGAVYSPYVESEIMALYAVKMGIPREHIFIEKKAEHSTENTYYSYYEAKELGFKNIALASDPFQVNNLRRYIKKNNLGYSLLPVLYDTIAAIGEINISIDPSSAMIDTTGFIALPKRESFFKRLNGTLGKNIEYTQEDIDRRNN
jgi:hypothetical protein